MLCKVRKRDIKNTVIAESFSSLISKGRWFESFIWSAKAGFVDKNFLILNFYRAFVLAKKVVSPGAGLFIMKFCPGVQGILFVSHQEKVNVPAIPEVGGAGVSNDSGAITKELLVL